MKLLPACLMLTALLATQPARAYHEVGAGVDTCAIWSADRQTPTGPAALQDEQWALGFLTGIGYAGSEQDDPLNGVDANRVWTAIDAWCQQHPTDKFVNAAKAFFKSHPH
jgi:hypothetical protein